jgi:hypothetical protein
MAKAKRQTKKEPKKAEKPQTPPKMGRPSVMTPQVCDIIIGLVASTKHGLERLCRDNPELPSPRTIRQHIADNEDFSHRYAHAKEQQADVIADEIIDIADELVEAPEVGEGETPQGLSHEQISAAKLRIDARKWVAAKLKPKKYGERVVNEHTGKDGKDLFERMSDEELEQELKKGW